MERMTFQKKLILNIINTSTEHPTADDIYNKIHQGYPNISKATVYRNLKKMSSNGQIKRLEIADSFDRYDCFDLHHAKCIICNKIFDLNIPYQYSLDAKLSNQYDILGHDTIFRIICNDCKRRDEKNGRSN